MSTPTTDSRTNSELQIIISKDHRTVWINDEVCCIVRVVTSKKITVQDLAHPHET